MVLAGCSSTNLVFHAGSPAPPAPLATSGMSSGDALARWDDNGNGRIRQSRPAVMDWLVSNGHCSFWNWVPPRASRDN